MRALLAVAGVALFCAVWAADEKKPESTEERPKTFKRLIPADVLRDFPGQCFASTKCATIEPGHSWDLAPFCGRSTCVKAEEDGRLLELVEDCGPLPKANPKCKLSEKTNKTAPFPDCCPIFECEAGVKLEFPEIPTPPPPAKDAKA
uniref:Single domain-containing protein n=2 Tax=Lygus hesperus TaxID=30085 RepID=A0A146M2G4_LYGHE